MFKKFDEKESVSGFQQLKSSAQKTIRNKIIELYPSLSEHIDILLPKKDIFRILRCHEHIELVVNSNGETLFFRQRDGDWIPTLRLYHKFPYFLPTEQVDKGAIRFVLSGANVMCPGLTSAGAKLSTVPKDTIVVITAEGKENAIAIGKTILSTDDISNNRDNTTATTKDCINGRGSVYWRHNRRGSIDETHKFIRYIDENIIGKNGIFYGPFGRRRVTFCDYVESGRSLHFIEDYILKEVLPSYGNISNTTNVTSLQSSLYRTEVTEIIRESVNAHSDDEVLFTGHGASDIANKLLSLLSLDLAPIVFVNFSCHRSFVISWKKIGAKVVEIAETKDGVIDLIELEKKLNEYQHEKCPLIGYFSIASNLTGVLTDDLACSLLLHQYGALAIWDYTYAAPVVKIDVNPIVPGANEKLFYKDAIVFSMHKFIGGNQTSGVIVIKNKHLTVPVINSDELSSPIFCLMNQKSERNPSKETSDTYVDNDSSSTIEIIRAGLVMHLKNSVGVTTISQKLSKITKQMVSHIRTIPEIILLGNSSKRKLPIFSFLVRHPRGSFLHHNFVCSVLNDVFGIQARAGCKCAGRYAQRLLYIDDRLVTKYEDVMLEHVRLSNLNLKDPNQYSMHELLRPGFSRISVPYFISDQELAFVMEALKMVATEGWKLLPQYVMNPATGEFRHQTNILSKDRNRLQSIRYNDGKMHTNERRISGPGPFPQTFADCLQIARNLFNRARKMAHKSTFADHNSLFDQRSNQIRWFMLPSEAQDLLLGNFQNVKQCVPFDPSLSTSLAAAALATATVPISLTNAGKLYETNYSKNVRKLNGQQSFPSLNIVTSIKNRDFVSDDNNDNDFDDTIDASNSNVRQRCLSLDSKNLVFEKNKQQQQQEQEQKQQQQLNQSKSGSMLETPMGAMKTQNGTGPKLSTAMRASSLNECRLSEMSKKDGKFQIYLSEVTKEIANELKSEIREVISKVEDVLESSDSVDFGCSLNHSGSAISPAMAAAAAAMAGNKHDGSDDGKSDSISVNDVAEYLVEASKGMASEVTSEIRDVVSAVDIFITPDSAVAVADSSSPFNYKSPTKRYFRKPTISESVIHDKNFDIDNIFAAKVANNYSQDSGINLFDHEATSVDFDKQSETASTCSRGKQKPQQHSHHQTKLVSSDFHIAFENCFDLVSNNEFYEQSKWNSPSKSIWNAFIQANCDYGMITNNDRILVPVTSNPNSISLVHILHQYSCYVRSKNVHFQIMVTFVDLKPDRQTLDILEAYFSNLGIKFVPLFEDTKEVSYCIQCSKQKRKHLYSLAKTNDCNVIAFSENMDQFMENFFTNFLHHGKLRTKKAQAISTSSEKIRKIQPLVYCRQKLLQQVADNGNYPSLVSNVCLQCAKLFSNLQTCRKMISQQETLIPDLFKNLRTALQPLMGFKKKN